MPEKVEKPKDKEGTSTVSCPPKELTEEQEEKLSPLADFLSSSQPFVCPDGVFVVPKCPDNYRREVRKQHAFSNRAHCAHFIEREYIGSYFTLAQRLSLFAIEGEYDFKNIFNNISYLDCVSRTSHKLTSQEMALLYHDVLSMYDYIECETEDSEKITRSEVDDSLERLEAWNDFEFKGFVKDLDDFRQKKKYLYPLTEGSSDRFQKYCQWLKKQKTFLNSGDAKLRPVKESTRKGEPGYMRVN